MSDLEDGEKRAIAKFFCLLITTVGMWIQFGYAVGIATFGACLMVLIVTAESE